MKIRSGSVLQFFFWVYGLSIPFWITELYFEIKVLPLQIPFTDIFTVFTPTIAAIILIIKYNGIESAKVLIKRIFDINRIKNKNWLLLSLVFPVILFLLNWLMLYFFDVDLPPFQSKNFLTLALLTGFFFIGAAAEEIGYTGYLTKLLQSKYSFLTSALIIGIPWSFWHVPSMLQQKRSVEFIIWGILGTIAFRVIYVWYYNKTNRSLFAVIGLHTLYNLGRFIFPHTESYYPLVAYPEIHYSIVILLIITIISINK